MKWKCQEGRWQRQVPACDRRGPGIPRHMLTLRALPTPRPEVKGHTHRGPSSTSSTIVSTSTLPERGEAPVTCDGHGPVPVTHQELLPEPRRPPRGQEYLQQGQGLQGDLSHQADHGGPDNKSQKSHIRWETLPFPPKPHRAPIPCSLSSF